MQEMQVWSLGRKETMEKEMATHSTISCPNPIDRWAWLATVHGVEKSQTWFSDYTTIQQFLVQPVSLIHLIFCSFPSGMKKSFLSLNKGWVFPCVWYRMKESSAGMIWGQEWLIVNHEIQGAKGSKWRQVLGE